MRIVITKPALADLTEIQDFIARDNPRAASAVIERIYATIQRLADGELHGPAVRLLDGRRAQRWPVPPYRIYYRRSSQRTVIVRVHHQAWRPIE